MFAFLCHCLLKKSVDSVIDSVKLLQRFEFVNVILTCLYKSHESH